MIRTNQLCNPTFSLLNVERPCQQELARNFGYFLSQSRKTQDLCPATMKLRHF